MKKLILLLIIYSTSAKAQYLSLTPVFDIQYTISTGGHQQSMVLDSSIYTVRAGCLQVKNLINNKEEYRLKNHYPVHKLIPDGKEKYVFLSGTVNIGKYDSLLNEYVMLNTFPFSGGISDIDLTPNGNIWACGSQQTGIYTNNYWTIYPTINTGPICAINDTSAYVIFNSFNVGKFHNGITDSLFNLPVNAIMNDWDIDSLGNIWIALENELVYLHDTTAVYFDSTNTPVGTELFRRVIVGKNGHVWTCGVSGKFFEYDGNNWYTHSLPNSFLYVESFNLDSSDYPCVIASNTYGNNIHMANIFRWNGSNFNNVSNFGFNPFKDAKAISGSSLVIDQGIFDYSSFNVLFQPNNFLGQPQFPDAEDVICVKTNSIYAANYTQEFGTHHGLFDPNLLSSALDTVTLPNDTVNYFFSESGSDYICTNNGLLVFNGTIATVYNTSNSPLPSNKITFATSHQGNPNNSIYIGTDKGMAIFSNNVWTVIDSAAIGSGNFYVTGISPPEFDSTTYISTMGNGLIQLHDSGGFQIYNTANGNSLDDSLYYVRRLWLGKCGDLIVAGSNSHGVIYKDYYSNSIQYCNNSTNFPCTRSRAMTSNYYYGSDYTIATDSGLYFTSACGGIKEQNPKAQIKVFPNPTEGLFTISHSYSVEIEIYNVLSELIYSMHASNNESMIDLRNQSKGMYFIKTKDLNNSVTINKIIIQ